MANTLSVSGAATFQNNVTVNGNLTVLGNQTLINTNSLEVKDSAILIADGNAADAIPVGIQVQYQPSGSNSALYAGMKRRPQTGEFVFFKDSANTIENSGSSGSAPTVTSYQMTWISDQNDSFILDNSNTSPLSGISSTMPQRVSGGTQVQGYSLPAGTYNYSATYRLDDNYASPIVITNASNVWDNPTSPTSTPANIICTIVPAAPRWSSGGPFTGSFTLSQPTVIYAGNPDNYYMGGTMVALNLTLVSSPVPSDIYATLMADGFNCASDARLKKNVVELDGALSKIDAIRGVNYNWVDASQPQDLQIGVIAQEIQAVYPELVKEGGNGYLSVDYPKLTAVLLQSVKELKAMVLALANKQ